MALCFEVGRLKQRRSAAMQGFGEVTPAVEFGSLAEEEWISTAVATQRYWQELEASGFDPRAGGAVFYQLEYEGNARQRGRAGVSVAKRAAEEAIADAGLAEVGATPRNLKQVAATRWLEVTGLDYAFVSARMFTSVKTIMAYYDSATRGRRGGMAEEAPRPPQSGAAVEATNFEETAMRRCATAVARRQAAQQAAARWKGRAGARRR